MTPVPDNFDNEIGSSAWDTSSADIRDFGGQEQWAIERPRATQWVSAKPRSKSMSGDTFAFVVERVGMSDDVSMHAKPVSYVSNQKKRSRIISLLARWGQEGGPFGEVVDPGAVKSAKAFIRSLRDDIPLPKIAPDGDEGVLLVWEQGDRVICAITVDEKILNVVFDPVRQPKYLNDLAFDNQEIPLDVTEFFS